MNGNMACFWLVDQLKAALKAVGKTVDILSWHPWLLADGEKAMDSVMILAIDMPGEPKRLHQIPPSVRTCDLTEDEVSQHFNQLWVNCPVFPIKYEQKKGEAWRCLQIEAMDTV